MPLENYYNRYNPDQHYDHWMFRSGYVLQSAEFNELQSALQQRVRRLGNAMLRDGDLLQGGTLSITDAGICHCSPAVVYLNGAVRDVPEHDLIINLTGTVQVGVYVTETVITELEDPTLRDPAMGMRSYQEPGAARLRVEASWGLSGGNHVEFYPLWTVVDGVVQQRTAIEPTDPITQALARYDVQSTGGSYRVSGMELSQVRLLPNDVQVLTVNAGLARVMGREIERLSSVEIRHDASPDLYTLTAEPHASSNATSMRVNVDYPPIADVQSVQVTKEKTILLVHGNYVGVADSLPNTSVLQIMAVSQGASTYTQGTDYILSAGAVNWSLSGAEPATGSTYTVTYRYIDTIHPDDVDTTGFTVAGAVDGSIVLVNYRSKLPRWDVLGLTATGDLLVIRGVSDLHQPWVPVVPADTLELARLRQTWYGAPTISSSGMQVVPMQTLHALSGRMDAVLRTLTQYALKFDTAAREVGIKKDLFSDPLLDGSFRDAGVFQSAAIANGQCQLAVIPYATYLHYDSPLLLTPQHVTAIEQLRSSSSMLVNPYQTFTLLPATVTLSPSVDQLVYPMTDYVDALTRQITRAVAKGTDTSALPTTETITEVAEVNTSTDAVIHPQLVSFILEGFAPGEAVTGISFGGINVTRAFNIVETNGQQEPHLTQFPVADGGGVVRGQLRIPDGIQAGTKKVQFIGEHGSFGAAFFTAESKTQTTHLRRVINQITYLVVKPVASDVSGSTHDFIHAMFRCYVGRDPSAAELQRYTTLLGSAVNDLNVLEFLFTEFHLRELGADLSRSPANIDNIESFIQSMYLRYFGRQPDEAGLLYWVNRLSQGAGNVILYLIAGGAQLHEGLTATAQEAWDAYRHQNCVTDPLAQSMRLTASAQVTGVDLYFSAKGAAAVVVQLRQMTNGLPSVNILAERRLAANDIAVNGTATRVLFSTPVYAMAGEDIALVVLCTDAVTALQVGKLGQWDGTAWITEQPYSVGVLFSSSNALTWTAHQDTDLKFKLLCANYASTTAVFDLGTYPVEQVTDLMILGREIIPDPSCSIRYRLTLPDGGILSVTDRQPVQLTAPVTGNLSIAALVTGSATASPVLMPDAQIMLGTLADTGVYVSRAMTAGADSRLSVIVDAQAPNGAALEVRWCGVDASDAWSDPMPLVAEQPTDYGFAERTYTVSGITDAMVRFKITMSGTAAARPYLRNIRAMIL